MSTLASRTALEQQGAFGAYGGRHVSELLRPALDELIHAREAIVSRADFQEDLARELADYAGRPTPLTAVPRFSEEARLEVHLKREDLLHGGAHKTNNVIGQGLLARRLGKRRLIAETGAGQHGVATAMIGARLGLEVVIYMGAKDAERQRVNVQAMELCGARVLRVDSGDATLKSAINEALRDWTASVDDTHYLLGTACGPHPFPSLVRGFQEVIGREARAQLEASVGGRPEAAIACIGGGSNAIGLFSAFLEPEDDDVLLVGVEPAGAGLEGPRHGAVLRNGSPGLLHGARTFVLQDGDGQVLDAHSIAAGLDYPGVGPEHAALRDRGRLTVASATDEEAVAAFELLSSREGIVPALESAHALAFVLTAVDRGFLREGARVLVNLSGRGQKDLDVHAAFRTSRRAS